MNLSTEQENATSTVGGKSLHSEMISGVPQSHSVVTNLGTVDDLSVSLTYICCEALGKCSAYCGAESSGP